MSTRRDFIQQFGAAGVLAATVNSAARAGSTPVPVARAITSYKLPHTDLQVSRLAYGWTGLGGSWDDKPTTSEQILIAERAIHAAYDNGITLFDLADVYALGKSEAAFGEVLKRSPGLREKIVIQSKCGLRLSLPVADPPRSDPHHIDCSYEHIVSAAEASLRRLGTDRLDILLLHRPDALVEPEEVARAFDDLQRSGKVRYFGVSNHTGGQIELLKSCLTQPLIVNQVQLGLMHPELITDGIDMNREGERRLTQGYSGAAGTLDYCRLSNIQIQAYSPVRGLRKATPGDSQAVQKSEELLAALSREKGSSPFALGLSWLLRHPARIVPIIGATRPEHIVENCTADRIKLERREWYALLYAATGVPPVKVL